MFFFSCPSCSSRVALCAGKHTPKMYRCPGCSIALAFVFVGRTLIEKIRDSHTPKDFIRTVNE